MTAELSALHSRARIHAALGDPVRLAIVDALHLGDASPGEIARDLGLPTNLVAHHLKVLTGAGVVTRTRSEGDGRRTYVRLRSDALATLAPFALGQHTPARPAPGPVHRVVFVCTRNSARSQLAAALWAHRTHLSTASAGTKPAPRVHPRAVAVARRHGLSLDPTGTAHVDKVVHDGDLLVTVCDGAHEGLAAPVRSRLHWSIPDPVPVGTDDAFEDTYTELASRINRLAPAIGAGAAVPGPRPPGRRDDPSSPGDRS